MSAQAHLGQKRQSGDDYVSHSVAVATILAEQQMDSVTIAAALLHDVVEDSNVSVEDIRTTFGPEVAELVDGLTKLSTVTFRRSEEHTSELQSHSELVCRLLLEKKKKKKNKTRQSNK